MIIYFIQLMLFLCKRAVVTDGDDDRDDDCDHDDDHDHGDDQDDHDDHDRDDDDDQLDIRPSVTQLPKPLHQLAYQPSRSPPDCHSQMVNNHMA